MMSFHCLLAYSHALVDVTAVTHRQTEFLKKNSCQALRGDGHPPSSSSTNWGVCSPRIYRCSEGCVWVQTEIALVRSLM